MNRVRWRTAIKKNCEAAGTYRPYFDAAIDTLSAILERRDHAEEQYRKSGSNPVVAYTNKGGATNLTINPALAVVQKLEADALAYWRDLGLTPAGLKRIDEQSMKPKKTNALTEALTELEKEFKV